MVLKTLLIALVALTLTNCSLCEKRIYVEKPVEVKVPVSCRVPSVDCNIHDSNPNDIVVNLAKCIVDLKEAQKVCQ